MKKEIRLILTEDMLGTVPLDKEIYSNFIESKKPPETEESEVDTVADIKGETGFHEDKVGVFIYDYMIKGFLKEACSCMRRVTGSKSSKLAAFKKVIDGLVFIYPRKLYINTQGEPMGVLERPLRASTAQGERVALAKSQTVPSGSTIDFEVNILGGVTEDLFKELMDYGAFKGLGQWRNASYGRFEWNEVKRS